MKAEDFVIVFTTVISGALAAVVICVPVISASFSAYKVPAEIKEWGGVIVGFYFGSFSTFMIEYMRTKAGAQHGPRPDAQDGQGQSDQGQGNSGRGVQGQGGQGQGGQTN